MVPGWARREGRGSGRGWVAPTLETLVPASARQAVVDPLGQVLGDDAEVVNSPCREQVACGGARGGAGLGVGCAHSLLSQSDTLSSKTDYYGTASSPGDTGGHLARVKMMTRRGGVGSGGGGPRRGGARDALVPAEPAEAVEDLVRVEVVTAGAPVSLAQVGGGRGRGCGRVTQGALRSQAGQGGGQLVRRGGAVSVRLA